jgi:hypothetical protein
MNCTAIPELACHAIWQCINHAPGLSIWNAITMYPPAGTIAVSLLGGLERLAMKVVESKGEEDWARM